MKIIFYITEMAGLAAFAASGAVTGIKNKLDIFGVLVLGTLTALGGGLIRDILLGHFPPRMFYNYRYLTVALTVSAAVFLFVTLKKRKNKDGDQVINNKTVKKITQKAINFFDTAGLAFFTVVGCGYAIEAGFGDNAFFVVFLGMMTGIGGGILRDVLSATIPTVLKSEIYATASIAGGVVYYFSERFVNQGAAVIAGSVVILIIRFAAAYFRWNMPKSQNPLG